MKKLMLVVLVQLYLNATMADKLLVNDGTIRMMPPSMGMTAGFVEIKNTSNKDITISSVSSDLAKFTELHTSFENSNGTMSMKHLNNLVIKANSSVKLQAGGKHIMFMRLSKKLVLNTKHVVSLHLRDGSIKNITLYIKEI
jgi:copper(I)-binding protein